MVAAKTTSIEEQVEDLAKQNIRERDMGKTDGVNILILFCREGSCNNWIEE